MWKLLDFAVFRQLISRSLASYAISVRRTKDLPTASFRFHLTMDTLAIQLYISHYLGMFRTFTCESAPMARKRNVRRQAHIKKAEQDAGISACHLIQLLFLTNKLPSDEPPSFYPVLLAKSRDSYCGNTTVRSILKASTAYTAWGILAGITRASPAFT